MINSIVKAITPYKNPIGFAYSCYSFQTSLTLKQTIESTMEDYKQQGLIDQYKVMPNSVNCDEGVIAVCWIKDDQLDGTTITWRD